MGGRAWVTGAERWLMRRFDVVSTISNRMHQRLLAKGVAAARAKLGIGAEAVVALYSGNMGGKQGLEVLADTARLCLGAQIMFVFCGNGAGRAELMARCAGLPNVRFLDSIDE